ncbi:MAG: hypothetical protein NC310_03380 [Roseburia sp.]|nr:hypothetical protein [Anaeroplasma bactoclasticum]MCM1196101.1 hypothetical protein [Roseburia sp.]MCM1557341.1 hypothetical protein [Anaeroplasma bactoclasticum]
MKEKYMNCPFCGSSNIKYFEALTREMFLKKYGSKAAEELTWYEKEDYNLYNDCDEEEYEHLYKDFLEEEKKEGRFGICIDCGQEFREFVNPKLDEKIKSMTKIPVEEYMEAISKEISSFPMEVNGKMIKEVLGYLFTEKFEHKKFYYKELLDDDIKAIQDLKDRVNLKI